MRLYNRFILLSFFFLNFAQCFSKHSYPLLNITIQQQQQWHPCDVPAVSNAIVPERTPTSSIDGYARYLFMNFHLCAAYLHVYENTLLYNQHDFVHYYDCIPNKIVEVVWGECGTARLCTDVKCVTRANERFTFHDKPGLQLTIRSIHGCIA